MCLMQAMQEQLPAAARVLTPAGHRWRSKMLTHFVEPAGDLCPSKFMNLYWGFEASLKCLRGIDSKRDCNSRFDPLRGRLWRSKLLRNLSNHGGSLDHHTAP